MLKMIYLGITLLNVLMVMVMTEELKSVVKEYGYKKIKSTTNLKKLVAFLQLIIILGAPILHLVSFVALMVTTTSQQNLEIAIDKVIEENYQ